MPRAVIYSSTRDADIARRPLEHCKRTTEVSAQCAAVVVRVSLAELNKRVRLH